MLCHSVVASGFVHIPKQGISHLRGAIGKVAGQLPSRFSSGMRKSRSSCYDPVRFWRAEKLGRQFIPASSSA